MVYILRQVSIYVSVDVAVRTQFTNAFAVGVSHPSHCFLEINFFAAVFGYTAAFKKANGRETT